MENSILTTIKTMLGITDDYDAFDSELIMHINSVFMILTQLGVGPSTGYAISNSDNTWDEFISQNTNIECVKSYMYMRVKMLFDPPSSSSVMDSMNRMINECEWRLNVAVDNTTNTDED